MTRLDEGKASLWQEIDESGDLLYCLSCGTCIVGCPASEASPPLLVRSLARMAAMGLEEELIEEDTPWICVTCSRCEEMCPMGVRPFELNLQIRKWQCRQDETRIPPSIVEIFKHGYTQALDKAADLRASVGLSDELKTLGAVPGLREKFQAMLMQVEALRGAAYMFKG